MNIIEEEEQKNFYKKNSINLKLAEHTYWIFCFDNDKMCQNVDGEKKEIDFSITNGNCECYKKNKRWVFTLKNYDRPITYFDLCFEFIIKTRQYKPCKHNFIEDFRNGDFQYGVIL